MLLGRPYQVLATAMTLCAWSPVGAQMADQLGKMARYTTVIPNYDDVVRTIGLAPLSQLKLERGWREVRLWVSGPGPVLKSRVVRVVQSPDSVFGEVYQWWHGDLDQSGDDLSCRGGQSRDEFMAGPDSADLRPVGIVACRLEVPDPNWAGLARRLDELDVWDLGSMQQLQWSADGQLSVRKGADGTSVTGETLNAGRYHAFYWWEPRVGDGPDAAAAREVVERVFALERSALSRN